MPVAPTSVRKTRARRVFGEVVVDPEENQADLGNSLCYSLSNSESSSFVHQTESFPVTKPESTSNMREFSSETGQSESKPCGEEKENKTPGNIFCIAMSDEKMKSQEGSVSAFPTDVSMPLPENRNKQRSVNSNEIKMKQTTENAASRKLSRRALANKTQIAITEATASVNESLNAARSARSMNFQEKTQRTNRFRDDWKAEAEEARKFQQEAAKMRRGLLELQSQLSSQFQQQRSRTKINDRAARLKAISEQSEFESKAYRDHKKSLKDERDRKRRESSQARSKLRENYRQGEEKLKSIQMKEHLALMEERNEGYNASTRFKKQNAEKRRKSYAFRSGDAKRIREIYNRMQDDEANREAASYQLKFEGERDAQAYKQELEEDRRKSLAFRNEEASKQRKLLRELEEANNEKEHQSYELKKEGEKDAERYIKQMADERRLSFEQRNKVAAIQRNFMEEERVKALQREQESINLKLAGDRDADEYRKNVADERRKSLAQRNLYARRQRDQEYEEKREAWEREHESYELKWAGEKDAEAFGQQLKKERRESLAFRNKESFQHAKVMDELRAIEREREAESYMLKWAGERDAKEYESQMQEERRNSLKLRNEEGARHRQIEEDQRIEEINRLAEDERIRADDHRDVEDYQKELAARDRASLLFNRKEANLQRLEEKRFQQEEYEREQKNRALVDGANWDVTEYVKECKERRRMSLVVRAKEKSRHRQWEQKQADQAYLQRREDARLRASDRRHQEMALREERRRIALNAIRHAGCSFNVNAFSGII
mmetsp:Transcript_22335/g.33755  ORF Transcript_22335/g.33755 Transcript_22335/m.33755 type:complete len:783 (+) Transcript_22335:158-2506(+)|eukprot:CAMPEP_0178900114 /NCGR_PEP_ID=MMETSP0786-20121207/3288_1 /TAXON_ID=186022 /ORGANISM="Thalassionema frauenfeldii, Strain CCMP 1798" /LENGTH=782 /DNA_ID=CAMNT_0020571071 /DNA_START=62 /DNA_END=2410 /DNA_ORIENTATION=-